MTKQLIYSSSLTVGNSCKFLCSEIIVCPSATKISEKLPISWVRLEHTLSNIAAIIRVCADGLVQIWRSLNYFIAVNVWGMVSFVFGQTAFAEML